MNAQAIMYVNDIELQKIIDAKIAGIEYNPRGAATTLRLNERLQRYVSRTANLFTSQWVRIEYVIHEGFYAVNDEGMKWFLGKVSQDADDFISKMNKDLFPQSRKWDKKS